MQCVHPLKAWRAPNGEVFLSKVQQKDYTALRLPCGGCLVCRLAYAQAWALRCQLELQQHKSAVFTTLTYDDENVPPGLPAKSTTIPLWLKTLRRNTGTQRIRFYASAEYGERTHRPHFHAILYGLDLRAATTIEETWKYGHTRTEEISPARIAYTAGYCHKKTDYRHNEHERVDPLTGEVYTWRPPYKLMSRNPGIGGKAREWAKMWRMFAIKDGHKMPVPRYLHEAWKAQATAQQQEDLIYEKSKLPLKDTTEYALNAIKKGKEREQQLNHAKRSY